MIESFFVLLLLIFTNFTNNTLPIEIRSSILNSVIYKQLIVLLLIYFSVKEWKLNKSDNFHEKIYDSLILWVIYLLLIKFNSNIRNICIVLLLLLYIMHDYRLHVHKYNDENDFIQKYHVDNIISYLNGLIILIFIYGLLTINYKFKKENTLLENLLDHK